MQKYYTPDHLRKVSIRNNGEIDSYYIEDNHSPIVSKEMWEAVQIEIKRRAKAKGNVTEDTAKYTKRYPLTGMLYCSKCMATLRRRTWNSKQAEHSRETRNAEKENGSLLQSVNRPIRTVIKL